MEAIMYKIFSKRSLRILKEKTTKIFNLLLLISMMLSNVTGGVQARTEDKPAPEVVVKQEKKSPIKRDAYNPPVFTHPAPRLGTSADNGSYSFSEHSISEGADLE